MRVGIFETSHFEGAYPVIRLFDNGSNQITIFCYQESYKQFQHLFRKEWDKYRWIIRGEKESKYKFIYRVYREVRKEKIELLYLNTINDNFIFYAWMIRLLRNVRVLVTIHSINYFFWSLPTFSLRAIIRKMGKKELVRVVDDFNVVTPTLVDYLRNKLPKGKRIHVVPGAVYEGRANAVVYQEPGKSIHVVVPGALDERRRDYQLVLELMRRIRRGDMPVSITLLGGLNPEFGIDIIKKIKMESFGPALKYYEQEVVDQPEFDKVMDEADLVLLPSAIHTLILDAIPEDYGITQSTGTLFDVIKHAKPFIAPLSLRVDPYLEGSCLRYESVDEIIDELSALSNSPEVFANLKSKARAASENYTIEAVRERNKDLFG